MKGFYTLFLLFLFLFSPAGVVKSYSFASTNNNSSTNSTLINLDSLNIEDGKVNKRFQKLLQKLDKDFEKHKKSEALLRLVFYRTQQQVLNKYVQYSSFNELLQDGSFDCVSGSTLYALILDRYNFDYKIIETSYHVFLIVELNDREFIIESTEPINGYLSDKSEIEAYKLKYQPTPSERVQQKIAEKSGTGSSQLFEPVVYNSISLEELIGLQFFNKAVFYFNQEQFFEAYNNIVKAKKYYPSERLLTLSKILEKTVFTSSAKE